MDKVVQVGNIVDDTDIGFKNPQRGRIYSIDGIAPCLNCCGGGRFRAENSSSMKIVKIWRKPHGYFKGGVLDADIFPTITTRTGDADIDLIVEIYETKRDIRTIEE